MKNSKFALFYSAFLLLSLLAPVVAPGETTPAVSGLPVIVSSASATMTQGAPFSYQIRATNSPTSYGASGLPSGLTVNPLTGLVSGTVLTAQSVTVQVTARNVYGQASLTVTLTTANSTTATGSTNNCVANASAPVAAAGVRFNRMAFCDDFDSLATIDTQGSGAGGFNWYTYRPEGVLPQTAYKVANSALTLGDSTYAYNWGLSTGDMRTGNGRAWTFGYFEARVSFNPTLGTAGPGWPSFWSISAYKVTHLTTDVYAELDFFEAFPQNSSPGEYYGAYGGTLHDWRYNPASGANVESSAGYTDYINGRNVVPSGVDWTQWHVVGCLWIPGQVTWYLDGKPMLTQYYSATTQGSPVASDVTGATPAPVGVFSVLDAEQMGMMAILGSGPKWPMNVDYVRVWQQ